MKTSALKLYRARENALRKPATVPELRPDRLPNALDLTLADEWTEQRQELIRHILAELKQLPAPQRQAVDLMILREPPLKLREVAEMQDAPISTVHSRLQAAIEKLGRSVRDHLVERGWLSSEEAYVDRQTYVLAGPGASYPGPGTSGDHQS